LKPILVDSLARLKTAKEFDPMDVRPEVTGRKPSEQPLHGVVVSVRGPPIGVPVSEAARLSGLSRSYIWVLIKNGRLKTISVGRRRIVLFQSLLELLGAN
jgi:excisionase family DNA binding protein